jgi:hypothetical protein
MIHFYENMIAEILKNVKESSDCAEICKDINRIKKAIAQVQNCGDRFTANQLDRELRQKYPCIDGMLDVANSIPCSSLQITKAYSSDEAVIESLWQDYYGILCGTAVKKGYVHSVEELIKYID